MSTSQISTATAKPDMAEVKHRVGDQLRDARLAKGLELSDVASELRISRSDLNCLETMYAPGIKRGYLNPQLRAYARFLGLPADELIKNFSEQCGAVAQSAASRPEPPPPPSRTTQAARAAAAGFVTALALFGLGFGATHLADSSGSESAAIAEATPIRGGRVSLLDTVGTEKLEPQLPLALVALQDSWLEVRGEDGTKYRERIMSAGEVYFPRIGAGWTVSARNGAAFEWRLGDITIGPLSETAAPVYALNIDRVATRAQEITSPAIAGISEARPTR